MPEGGRIVDPSRPESTRHEYLSTSPQTPPPLTLLSTTQQAPLVVTTLADVIYATDGVLSLREAVLFANANPGPDTITFADDLRGGTITLDRDLGTLTITDDLVIDGDPLDGGAGGIVIDGNRLAGFGQGTIPFAVDGAHARVEDLTVQNGYGLGIAMRDADLVIHRSIVRDNLDFVGVGIAGSGNLAVFDSAILNNGGATGAGIRLTGDLLLERSTLADNSSEFGAAVALVGQGRIVDSSIVDNRFFAGYGVDARGALEIVGSTLARNGAAEDIGGAAVRIDGELVMINSTVAETGVGIVDPSALRPSIAAVQVDPGGRAELTNVTITGSVVRPAILGDTELPGAGLYLFDGATATLANSIIDDTILGPGNLVSNGANTFRDTTVAGVTGNDRSGVRAETLFALTEEIGTSGIRAGVIADNGGPTLTVALLDDPANPALDRADPADAPPTDQRGFLRDAAPDIGAFELGAGPLPPLPPAPPLPPLAEKVPLADADILGVPRGFLTLTGGDAAISLVDEYAAFQNSLGVYLVGPDGTIGSTAWVFERVEHALPSDLASALARPGGGPLSPGDTVLLSDLFAPTDLAPGVEFGLFLVADGWTRNPETIFDGGTLDFRIGGGTARVDDTTPQLFHVAENGVERLVLGDILHTIDAGSPNPLSNTLNPGGTGQTTSGLLDGLFTVAFEDKPLTQSDRDFNDALFAIELLDGGDDLLVAAAAAPATIAAAALEALVASDATA